MAGRVATIYICRDRRLPVKESIMAVTPIRPGEHLKEELETLDMSAAELARKLNVPTNRITHILNGRRGITGDTALRLSHFFGTSAEFWLNLQSLYDLRLAPQQAAKTLDFLPPLNTFSPSPAYHPHITP